MHRSLGSVTVACMAASGVGLLSILTFTDKGRRLLKLIWEGDVEARKREKALKKLARLAVKLGEVEDDVEEHEERLQRLIDGDESMEKEVSSYYHFDSAGRRFPSKWDTFDVDEALERLDEEEGDEESVQEVDDGEHEFVSASWSKMRTSVGRVSHNMDRLLAALDQVRGDDSVKARRREIVERSQAACARLDVLMAQLER